MLVAPLWILLYVTSKQRQLAVITVFMAVFLGIMQSVTIARPFESLATTAA
jgi:nitrogen fixation/metabolism regulation signal transduction histidine kinase